MVLPRVSHHRHSGRLRPHHETSYALLVFLILLAMMITAMFALATQAATSGGGQVAITAVVTGPRPTTPALITSPVNGQSFSTNPITVSGTCPARTLVKIFKNGILAGSGVCDANRHFSLQLDLVVGANALTALAFNGNDLSGPDSPAVNVTLNPSSVPFGFSSELLLQSVNYYRGAEPGDQITWPVEIVGGVAPYAVTFDWGDGRPVDLLTRTAPGPFNLNHTYNKVGGYLGAFPLIIRATDSVGHTAFLQLTSIINAPTGNAKAGRTFTLPTINLMMVWPILIILLFMVLCFWLGERREKHLMQRQMEAAS